MTFALTVTFRLHPGQLGAFIPLMLENAHTSLRDEPGCRVFDVALPEAEANSVFLWEIYDDRAAFDAHLAGPHFRAFDAASAPMVAEKTVRFLTVLR